MRIGLLEDDRDQAQLMELWLTRGNHSCYWYKTGAEFQRAARSNSFDLVVIDWMLPDTTGDEVLVWLREFVDPQVPVLFATRRESEEDIVSALQKGADDYMVKPVREREFLARVAALARRATPHADMDVHTFGQFQLNSQDRSVTRGDEVITLTPREFDLAIFLFRNAGRLLSRGHILENVWGSRPDLNTRTVDTHISRLRRKLGLEPEHGCRLSAVYHHGYRLEMLPEAGS